MKAGAKVCAWPPYRMPHRLNNAVQSHEIPKSHWQWIKVDVMKTVDTYDEGLAYEEEALYKSDLGTESDNKVKNQKFKKKRKRTVCQEISSDDEGSKLAAFPRIKEVTDNDMQGHSSQLDSFNCTDSSLKNYIHPNSSPIIMQSHENSVITNPNGQIQEIMSSIGPHQMEINSQSLNPSCTPVQEKDVKGQSFQKKVLRILETIRQDIQELKAAQKICRNPLPQLPPCCPKLPCENPEDLADLDDVLKEEATFANICEYFSTIGGRNAADCTKRILQQVISTSLSLKYNWKGTRGVKLGFAIFTSITKLILGAVRNNHNSSLATEVEVTDVIKKWLMHAKDRDGGRSKRAVPVVSNLMYQ